jgi:hypothetical protein
VSLDSGRDVDGSVVGGENMVSTAGVLGGNASRFISAVRTGADMESSGTSGGVMVRLMLRRGRPLRDLDGGFSGFSCADERCFFGDIIGSVLTGSVTVSYNTWPW